MKRTLVGTYSAFSAKTDTSYKWMPSMQISETKRKVAYFLSLLILDTRKTTKLGADYAEPRNRAKYTEKCHTFPNTLSPVIAK